MTFLSVIADKIKEILKNMIGSRTIERELHVAPAVSSAMEEAIQLWTDMYKNEAYWLHEPTRDDPVQIVSLGLPALISSEKARTALLEFKSEVTTPTEEVEEPNPDFPGQPKTITGLDGQPIVMPSQVPPETITKEVPVTDTARAEFLNFYYQKMLKQDLRRQLEFAVAKGGMVIKPYIVFDKNDDGTDLGGTGQTFGEKKVTTNARFEFDFIHADCFYPLGFDAGGHIVEAAFIQTKTERDVVYRRLEYHKWSNHKVEIINKAFKTTNGTNEGNINGLDLGKEIKLTEVSEWANLQPRTTVKNVSRPLFAYFRMPEANTVDTTSPLGVSGFSRAVKNIRDADMQYSRLLWEYEGGELAIDIDRDAIREDVDRNGVTYSTRPHLQARLLRQVDLGSQGDTYNPYAPTLRDTSYIQGLNTILMRIEDICGISRGTLSDAASEARTATELKILKQRSFQTNKDIQDALEQTLRDVIYIMDVYCTLYNAVGDTPLDGNGVPVDGNKGQWDVSFEWDDSILVDVDEELNKRLSLMQAGIVSKLEIRQWYFGETERQAKDALQKVDEEAQQSMEENMMMETAMAAQQQNAMD